MKKKTVFRVVLIVWCVLCTLSVLQVRNVLANHRQNERNEHLIDAIRHGSLDGIDIGAPDWFKPGEVVQILKFPYYANEFSEQKTDDSDDEYSLNLPPIDAIRRDNLDGIDIGAPDWFKPGEVVQKIEFPYYSDEFSKQKTDNSDDEYSHNFEESLLPEELKNLLESMSMSMSMEKDLFLRGPWISYAYINDDICELHLKEMKRETVEIIHSNVPNYLGIEYNESMKNSFRNSNEPIYSEHIAENNFEKYICEECNKIRDEYMGKRIQ